MTVLAARGGGGAGNAELEHRAERRKTVASTGACRQGLGQAWAEAQAQACMAGKTSNDVAQPGGPYGMAWDRWVWWAGGLVGQPVVVLAAAGECFQKYRARV